jgi:hypothetical protein
MLTMSRSLEYRRTVIEFVERWDGPCASLAVILFAFAAVLTFYGAKQGDFAKETAEYIDFSLLGAGAFVGGLRAWNWHLRTRTPIHPPYRDPLGILPVRDTSEYGLVFLSPEGMFGYPKYRFFIPSLDDLEVFVEWSDEEPEMNAANPGLQRYQRALLYRDWYGAEQRSFLIMQSKSRFGGTWDTKAISIVLPLPRETYQALKRKEIGVIDLRKTHLTYHEGEESKEYLLYDTLIVNESIRSTPTEFKFWHSLFHFSLFQAPAENSPLSILIEPDNPTLARSFDKGRYGSFTKFTAINGHTFYELVVPKSSQHSPNGRRFVPLWQELRNSGFRIEVGS